MAVCPSFNRKKDDRKPQPRCSASQTPPVQTPSQAGAAIGFATRRPDALTRSLSFESGGGSSGIPMRASAVMARSVESQEYSRAAAAAEKDRLRAQSMPPARVPVGVTGAPS